MDWSIECCVVIIEYGLEYYTEVQDLSYLLEHVSDDPLMIKYKKLTGALVGIVEDYSLVNYMTLNVEVCLICLLSLTTIYYIIVRFQTQGSMEFITRRP